MVYVSDWKYVQTSGNIKESTSFSFWLTWHFNKPIMVVYRSHSFALSIRQKEGWGCKDKDCWKKCLPCFHGIIDAEHLTSILKFYNHFMFLSFPSSTKRTVRLHYGAEYATCPVHKSGNVFFLVELIDLSKWYFILSLVKKQTLLVV